MQSKLSVSPIKCNSNLFTMIKSPINYPWREKPIGEKNLKVLRFPNMYLMSCPASCQVSVQEKKLLFTTHLM